MPAYLLKTPLHRLPMLCTLVTASASFSGCLLLDPVNQPPAVPVIGGPAQMARGQVATFTAEVQDADGDDLTVLWGQAAGACPVDPRTVDSEIRPAGAGLSHEFKAPAELGLTCIWALARDAHGAEAIGTMMVEVKNDPPVARLSLAPESLVAQTAQGLSLYRAVRVSAAASADPDAADYIESFRWEVIPPGGMSMSGTPCANSPRGEDLCFMPATPGAHRVNVTAFDNLGAPSAQATLDVLVAPDQPPCLRDTEQATPVRLRRFDEAVAFSVAVDDDGDPVPPRENELSQLRFVWYVKQSETEGWLPLVEFDQSASLRLPPNRFRQGDEVHVRVEGFDRSHRGPLPCPVAQDRCEATPGCPQRLSWSVRYVL